MIFNQSMVGELFLYKNKAYIVKAICTNSFTGSKYALCRDKKDREYVFDNPQVVSDIDNDEREEYQLFDDDIPIIDQITGKNEDYFRTKIRF